MANVENNALSNTITLVKNYVDDPNNLYGVLRDGLVTGDLETPFISFVGAKTMVYPVFPLNTEDLPDYSGTQGFARVNVNYERKEETVTQDKGYQIAVDRLDLLDWTNYVINNNKDVTRNTINSILSPIINNKIPIKKYNINGKNKTIDIIFIKKFIPFFLHSRAHIVINI